MTTLLQLRILDTSFDNSVYWSYTASIVSSSSCPGYIPMPSTRSPGMTMYLMSLATGSLESHFMNLSQASARNSVLPTCMSDTNATTDSEPLGLMPLSRGTSGLMTSFAMTISPSLLNEPMIPRTSSFTNGSTPLVEFFMMRTW